MPTTILRRFLLLLPLPVVAVACSPAPAERPEKMVNLQTVQSGPHIQAEELDGAIARQPRNASLYARRADFHLDAGHVAAGMTDIDRALELDDEVGEYYFIKARALRAQNRLTAALAAAGEASRRGYSSPELTLLVGETHLAARHYQDALDRFDRVLQQEPDQAAALFYKGVAYAATADTVQALDYLRASLARDPRQPETLHQLAFLANAYRLPAQAARYAGRGLRLDPQYAALWYDYGRQFELQGQPDSARRQYLKALTLDSTLYRADYRLGLAAYQQRQYAVAAPYLRRAVRRAPRLPEARAMLAESYENTGHHPEALAQYRLLVAENPGNKHWTYKAWKTGDKVRQLSDTLRRRPVIAAPLTPRPARPAATEEE